MILESAVAVLLHLVSLAATENMAVHERDLRGVRKQDAMAEAPLTDKFKRQVRVGSFCILCFGVIFILCL